MEELEWKEMEMYTTSSRLIPQSRSLPTPYLTRSALLPCLPISSPNLTCMYACSVHFTWCATSEETAPMATPFAVVVSIGLGKVTLRERSQRAKSTRIINHQSFAKLALLSWAQLHRQPLATQHIFSLLSPPWSKSTLKSMSSIFVQCQLKTC